MSNKLGRRAYLASALFPTLLLAGGVAWAADEVFRPTKAITLPGGQKIGGLRLHMTNSLLPVDRELCKHLFGRWAWRSA